MIQPTFYTTTEEHLGWDQMEFNEVLASLDAPQQAEEVGPSQLTQAPVWIQPTQPAAGGGTPAGGGTSDAAGSSQAAMATPSLDQLGPQRFGLALELLGRRGADTFRCSTTFTMILYKLFPSTR
jgi:hypothetical protein